MSSLNAPRGEVDHISSLSDDIGGLFLSNDYCDIHLIVEGMFLL